MPHDLPLQDLLVLLIACIPIAFICSRLRVPLLVGFMLTGLSIGPFGLGLIRDIRAVEVLAEIGVVLLLFTIGLEFSLRGILNIKRLVFLGGGFQVTLTVLAVAVVSYLFGRPPREAVFFGFLISLSSTAIVLKSYADRAELDSPHGKSGVGILLFQDLCIVPMMLLLPALGGQQRPRAAWIIATLAASIAVILIIIVAARLIMPQALYHIVRLRSTEIFVIFVVLVSLGTAWISAQFGLSLALGAFLAGLVLSESEYSHQIVADILPFRAVFDGIFFISIGMLLSLTFLISNALTVLTWVGALMIGKAVIVLAVVRLLGYSVRVSVTTGIGLAQVGEFSFILARAGIPRQLLSDSDYQTFLAAAIVSMLATPFAIRIAPRIGYAIQSLVSHSSPLETTLIGHPPAGTDLKGHVIIVGYGLNGRNLAKVLRRVNIPYLVLDLNAEMVRRASAHAEPIMYGDCTRREVLHRLNLEHARVVVLAISDPMATRRTAALARLINPNIHVIVRTRYMSEVAELYKLGSNQVIPEELETSIEIFARVLNEYGVPRAVIGREIDEIRREGYQMLRDPSLPVLEPSHLSQLLSSASTKSVAVRADSPSVGKTLADLDLRKRSGATIMAVVRSKDAMVNPGSELQLAADDILVLLGSPEQIETAVEVLDQLGSDSRRG
jgi:CPA2 family monovalent cation:H+ antiporter-2